MVTMLTRSPITPSNLSDGWHPAYLLHISEEATPGDWEMFKQSPTMYRWHFAAWETPTHLTQEPEVQSGLTSTKFTPKSRYQASKAYTWACQLLGRTIASGESVDFDPLYPIPCRIKTSKDPGKDFIKITDVESWPEGQQPLPAMKDALLSLRGTILQQPPPVIPPATAPAPAATPPPVPVPVTPGLQTWGSVQEQAPVPTTPAAAPKW
jgi:hypothetical protein